ncbi:hypothetical protein Glove_1g14 [Diversispora epigaea]|uniref:Uncharacterized protein n=1 Tax=Diversispora epigaea TaxID=1348612 RepID=A0A397JTJ9_9GLOM|nr:hypothetical protein Glove_1g14 [Diversispora epigaea]
MGTENRVSVFAKALYYERFFTQTDASLPLDYSKNMITKNTFNALIKLAKEVRVEKFRDKCLTVVPEVNELSIGTNENTSDAIRNGKWKCILQSILLLFRLISKVSPNLELIPQICLNFGIGVILYGLPSVSPSRFILF